MRKANGHCCVVPGVLLNSLCYHYPPRSPFDDPRACSLNPLPSTLASSQLPACGVFLVRTNQGQRRHSCKRATLLRPRRG